jgi:RNA polymerase sigma factor (sigma-70 family)
MSHSAIDDAFGSASAAFALAYSQGFPQTISFLIGKGVSFALAEEVAQVAWARGWEARHQLRLAGSVTAWINTIAFRRLCKHQRRQARSVALSEHQDPRELEPSLTLDAELLLSRCSPLDRMLLRQRYVDGMNLREIAATQGLSEMAVRLRLHRCRHGLRTIVSAGVSGAVRSGRVRR